MKSDQFKINREIQLMNVLEDFVLKKMKYPLGDQTERIDYYRSLGVNDLPYTRNTPQAFRSNSKRNHLEYHYEITEQDKINIYTLHAEGKFKETDQQKKYRETAVQQIILYEDPNDTVEIPPIDRLPRYYDDILTNIKQFFSYIESQETPSFKQVEKLRKKAFQTFAHHNDCQNLETVPQEIYTNFSNIHNGHYQQESYEVIRKSFLQYAEKVLLDENEVNKIRTIVSKDVLIQKLESDSIDSVKEAIIQHLKINIKKTLIKLISMNRRKNALLDPADPTLSTKAISIFNDHRYHEDTRKKLKHRISAYREKIDDLKGVKQKPAKYVIRKKFTGDSYTWLKQHKIHGKSLYQIIDEIIKKNKQSSYRKQK